MLQWKYTPTLLNGQPVPVIMTVTVTFTLNKSGEENRTMQVGQPAPTLAPPAIMTASGIEMVPVRVGGEIKEPVKIKHVAPALPATPTAGIVILEAIIDTDGKVRDVKALRPVPGLDENAVAAVRQWEYTPTLVNGVAVPVIMTVTVTFTVR